MQSCFPLTRELYKKSFPCIILFPSLFNQLFGPCVKVCSLSLACTRLLNAFSSTVIILQLSQYPVNMPDLIWRRFGCGQLWPLQPACSQNQAGSCMPEPASCIQFGCVFPKKAQIILWKTNQGSDLDGLVRFWEDAPCPEASWSGRIIGPSFWPNATGLLPDSPRSHSVALFHGWPGSYCAEPAWIQLGSGCVRFCPNRSGLEASQCARIIRPTSGQRFQADDWVWIGSGMFTG